MMNFFAKCFDKVCNVLAVLNILSFILIFVITGIAFCMQHDAEMILTIILSVALGIVGLLLGFLIDTIVFGFIAQIISIRQNLEKLNNK